MSETPPIASKWNARYAYASKDLPKPAGVLIAGDAFLPHSGEALDLACGRGGNAFYLAQRGFSVSAWDISSTAIEWMTAYQKKHHQHFQINPEVRDVIALPPNANSFDVIVVSRFLDRPLCAKLIDALKPDGVLFYQTFTAGLSNADYLLRPNELLDLFAALAPCYTFESPLDAQGRSEAYYVGRKEPS